LRILIFHGYLLSGTGSNVYNARLAEALVGLGHEVHLLCQERHPEHQAFVDAAGDWDSGRLVLRPLKEATVEGPRCTVYRPDIGGLLPLYVQDRYEGTDAKTFADCTDSEVAAYVQANVDAVRELVELVRPDVALANHLVMGPVIFARALAGRAGMVPYAVKVHGSALEYTVKPQPERFLGFAREGLAGAQTVLVGSRHTAESLWEALGETDGAAVRRRTRLGPPGVDVERFAPREPAQAMAEVDVLIERLRAGGVAAGDSEGSFARDEPAVADALEHLLIDLRSRRVPRTPHRGGQAGYRSPVGDEGELVAFVGKLIAAKGVHLLLAAWPHVLQRCPRARLVVIGFGSEGERFQAQAAPLGDRVIFTGRLDHDELYHVLPLCEALVVPSTFPEAFGMVAAEAAACGVLPISAAHSGLAEVSETIAEHVPPEAATWLSFPVDDDAPQAIANRIVGWLTADAALKAHTRQALVSVVRERWSWQGVARGVIAAARGEPVARPFG
jgi:glycosyltransferase involved in cell wall biosynthesis